MQKYVNGTYFLILVAGLIILSCLMFTIIYYIVDDKISFNEAFYFSVQIQTSVGAIDSTVNNIAIKNSITAQSLLAFMLNILLAVGVSFYTVTFHLIGKV
jgi:hypothetical protein